MPTPATPMPTTPMPSNRGQCNRHQVMNYIGEGACDDSMTGIDRPKSGEGGSWLGERHSIVSSSLDFANQSLCRNRTSQGISKGSGPSRSVKTALKALSLIGFNLDREGNDALVGYVLGPCA